MRKVFVAGNPLLKEDSLALEVARELEKKLAGVKFEEIDSLGSLKEIPRELCIIDVAAGIQRVEEITDLSRLQGIKLVSLHDFDMAAELLLYSKLGKLGKAVLIAIPSNYPVEKAVREVKAILLSGSV
jgi:Ni,Fe-hydrogenase maturation factor